MAAQYTQMTGRDFIILLLCGKKDFPGIALPDECDLSRIEGYSILKTFLIGQQLDHEQKPINITGSRFRNVTFGDLYLPFIIGENADLAGAHLEGAYLTGACLFKVDLSRVHLRRAHLGGAELGEAHLVRADLMGADLESACLVGARLVGAKLMGTKLGQANLKEANLMGATVTGADFREANLSGAYLRGIADLEHALNLGTAIYIETNATEKQIAIIDAAYKKVKRFV